MHSTNPLEGLNKEVKRRAPPRPASRVPFRDRRKASWPFIAIFPNEESITRLIGAILFEQNDEWQTRHQYMQFEAMAPIDPVAVDPILKLQPPLENRPNGRPH